MNVLGLSCGFSIGNKDTTCCLVVDGEIISIAHEERFNRAKKSAGYPMPHDSLDWTLKNAGLKFSDIDVLAVHGATFIDHEARLQRFFTNKYGICPPIDIFEHHLCHAASAYYSSGYETACVLTTDFVGDRKAGLTAVGRQGRLEHITYSPFPHSLGLLYGMITQFLGFELSEDEYKVMGLSAYGTDPVDLSFLVDYDASGYTINTDYIFVRSDGGPPVLNQEEWYASALIERIGRPRLKGEDITQRHKNIALGIQKLVEQVAVTVARGYMDKYHTDHICLAGGVALNVVMNQRLMALDTVKSIFIPPYAGDDGIGVGAAYLASVKRNIQVAPLPLPYLGSRFSDDDIQRVLETATVRSTHLQDPCRHAAQAIAAGEIVGWFQGASECGPRALGNRSIVADPRRPDMKDRVNAAVKFREPFRPFAPSVLEEKRQEYFENSVSSPYMNITCDVKDAYTSQLPAITHQDGTARLHSVSTDANPLFHQLLSEFGKLTSVYVLLNTSFNIKGQPIVDSPIDALGTFFGSGLTKLYLGSYLIEK